MDDTVNDTIERLEPNFSILSFSHSITSAAISLKRIADALEKFVELEETDFLNVVKQTRFEE